MDFLNELEAMANTVTLNTEASPSDIARWQNLFGYTLSEARKHIEIYRSDLSKTRVSGSHWDLIRHTKEVYGHDRESYSYSLSLTRSSLPRKQKRTGNTNATYISKLEGPISTPGQIQEIAGLTYPPTKSLGEGETIDASFCTISSSTRDLVLQWLDINHPKFTPTIVRLSKARKELSSYSLAPFLGQETTLPHQRASTRGFEPRPRQNEYPVWYFFYGRLLDPELLKRQLGLNKEPVYRQARIRGAKSRSWQGKYKAVVDGSEIDGVDGAAFLVENAEWEDGLRFFETDAYEVVRCVIEMVGDGGGAEGAVEEVSGLVFRFCGEERELV